MFSTYKKQKNLEYVCDLHVFNLSLRGVQWMVFLLFALGVPKTILVYDDLPENSEDPPNMIKFTYYSKVLEINIRSRKGT